MNFIEIDNLITSTLKKDIETYKKNLQRIKELKDIDITQFGGIITKALLNEINDLEKLKFSENILIMYKYLTFDIIKKLLTLIKQPMTKENKKEMEKQQKMLLCSFIKFVKKYIPINIIKDVSDISVHTLSYYYCEECKNSKEFLNDNDTIVCKLCFSELIRMAYYNNKSFWGNGVTKCNYDRISHFKDCLKQYQCKQNTFISPDVYKQLEIALDQGGLIDKTKKDKFHRIKKSHIVYFLRELNYNKHYDDYNLIYHNLTNKKPRDVSHIEDMLIDDFSKVLEVYNTININAERKNFINIQYILFKLLKRHNIETEEDEFISIKSFEKEQEREKLCKTIFDELGWKN